MEGSENQVHLQQHKEFEASLQHMRSNLKKGKKRKGKEERRKGRKEGRQEDPVSALKFVLYTVMWYYS